MSTQERITKLTINRKNWLRGRPDTSALRNSSGSMCCLGHLGRACGVEGKEMLNISDPSRLDLSILEKHPVYKKLTIAQKRDFFHRTTKFVNEAIEANDKEHLPLAEREKALKEIFGKVGIELTFTS